jgi:hypothetical protein
VKHASAAHRGSHTSSARSPTESLSIAGERDGGDAIAPAGSADTARVRASIEGRFMRAQDGDPLALRGSAPQQETVAGAPPPTDANIALRHGCRDRAEPTLPFYDEQVRKMRESGVPSL